MISGGSHPLDEREIEQLKLQLTEAEATRLNLEWKLGEAEAALAEARAGRTRAEIVEAPLREENRRLHGELAWLRGQAQTLRGICDGLQRIPGYDPIEASVTVRAIREIIDMEPPRRDVDNAAPAEVGAPGAQPGQAANDGARIVADALMGRLRDAELIPQPQQLDADLADINARVAADERVLDAAEAWRAEVKRRGTVHSVQGLAADLIAAVDARHALTGEQTDGVTVPSVEIEYCWCSVCEQDIVITDDGLFARHRHKPSGDDRLGPWCDSSGSPVGDHA